MKLLVYSRALLRTRHGVSSIRTNSTMVPPAIPYAKLEGEKLRILREDSQKLAELIVESQEAMDEPNPVPLSHAKPPRQNRSPTTKGSASGEPTGKPSRTAQQSKGSGPPKGMRPRPPRQTSGDHDTSQTQRSHNGSEQRQRPPQTDQRKTSMVAPSADLSAPSIPRVFEPRSHNSTSPDKRPHRGPRKQYEPRQPSYAERTRKKLLQDTASFRRSSMLMKIPEKRDEDADRLFIQKPRRSVPLANLRRVLDPTALLSKATVTSLPLAPRKLDVLSPNLKYQLDMERLRALPVTSEGLTVTQRASHVMTRNPTISIEKKRRSLERIARLVGEKRSSASAKQLTA
ncbi:hypothetical protein FRB94_005416 [Tulasnella sp. JGI-2019a]|nr:hypothetical protein FRB93_008133 [Tulasnella sp. JGI-2019a]KAG9000446.1 hypothetical protein FRB94_005416 [Tulasnella sp. JGI-2019a]KAG9028495.1 hypothetical protein FRB95_006396 [Tulasnella sp. JGI-2019a]